MWDIWDVSFYIFGCIFLGISEDLADLLGPLFYISLAMKSIPLQILRYFSSQSAYHHWEFLH